MKSQGKEELQELLQELVNSIYTMIKRGLSEKTLKPEKDWYLRWKITGFRYSDNGIISSGGEGENFLKPVWYSASRTIEQKIKKLNIYKDALKTVPRVSELPMPPDYLLFRLVSKVTWDILDGRVDSSKLNYYAISFIDDLLYKEHEYKAELQLRGLVLRPDSIKLDVNVLLRKPIGEDLEREGPVWSNHRLIPMDNPTAILLIKMRAKHGGTTVRGEISREIALLRLFQVGAVQPIRYTLNTDSILDDTGRVTTTTDRLLGNDKYLIKEGDEENLKTFWANMKRVKLPDSTYTNSQNEPNELSIAYERYSDALEGRIIEKRISSAVMGLEALYLSPSEQQEMSYRLRMRLGKLLGLVGYNPEEVCKNMIEAYDIRSTYVHGGILKRKDRQKLNNKYGDIIEFSKIIMDYLRASIVALLNKPSKTHLIKKIDASLLDSKENEEVKNLLFRPFEKGILSATG